MKRKGITKGLVGNKDAAAGSTGRRVGGSKRSTRERQKISAAIDEIHPVQEKLRPLLRRAWPDGSDKDVSWLAADLAGLWKVSRIHMLAVNRLLKMGSHPKRRDLADVLINLEINWIQDAKSHIQTLKRELLRFSDSL